MTEGRPFRTALRRRSIYPPSSLGYTPPAGGFCKFYLDNLASLSTDSLKSDAFIGLEIEFFNLEPSLRPIKEYAYLVYNSRLGEH